MKARKLFTSTLLTSLFATSLAVHAETVTRTTTVTRKPVTERVVYFRDFDLNRDQRVSYNEVGDKIFYLFDLDGNEIIDNVEYQNNENFITLTPTEIETVTRIDQDNDGYTDVERREFETFLQRSHLTMFDEDLNGLSPEEFIGYDFRHVDQNRDNAITLREWQATYMSSIGSTLEETDRYNN